MIQPWLPYVGAIGSIGIGALLMYGRLGERCREKREMDYWQKVREVEAKAKGAVRVALWPFKIAGSAMEDAAAIRRHLREIAEALSRIEAKTQIADFVPPKAPATTPPARAPKAKHA